jgi:amino acid adenylation domain-containing protein/thioester reductase-like protein
MKPEVSPLRSFVHQLFEDQVQRTPRAIAVRHESQSLTYEDLNARANRLARYLLEKGVGPDQLVGICVERSLEMVIGLLGVLKAGGAYIPLDPGLPAKRLQYMLSETAPRLLLTQARLKHGLPPTDCEIVTLDEPCDDIMRHPDDNPDALALGLEPHHLAYVIYTSGSTGNPKGVMIEHAGLSNYLHWALRTYPLEMGDAVPVSSPLAFDATITSLYPPLLSGRTLVLIPSGQELEGLEDLLRQPTKWSLVKITPAHLRLLGQRLQVSTPPCTVGAFVIGGEALPPSTVELWRSIWPSIRLINEYGPTETVVGCCFFDVPSNWEAQETVPIGRPIDNTELYILDEEGKSAPSGEVGEIYIGGAGVARGYLNRPDLTGERFVVHGGDVSPIHRLYRTGDMARMREDGDIEFLGRNDSQVKINGFRIELEEIRDQLLRYPLVKEAAVLAQEGNAGQSYLVGYVVPTDPYDTDTVLRIEALHAHLRTVLPSYMMPRALVLLESLPLTANGKLNRGALPSPELDLESDEHHEPPQGSTEEELARIWRRVLGIDRIGRQSNFFELGGQSLLALRMLLEIKQSMGADLRIINIYQNPTLCELARWLDEGGPSGERVDLAREAVLNSEIRLGIGDPHAPAAAVFLTGATGFVGRFLLSHLLEKTSVSIYCLVRASTQDGATARLKGTLAKWGLWRDDFEGRIVAILGNLTAPRLGMGEVDYRLLAERVDAIYHCGASVNHLETYAMAKAANVDVVKDLIGFAGDTRPKLLNHISTLAVFTETGGGDKDRVVDETSPIDLEKHLQSDGYEASKWVADKLVVMAGEQGLPCNIFRLGLIGPDREQGRYDEQQREYRVLKSCFLSGYGIEGYQREMPFTAVDYAAQAIVHLAHQNPRGGGTFHICGSEDAFDDLWRCCNEVGGLSLERKSWFEWIGEIKRLHHEGRSLPAVPIVEYAFSMDERTFREHEARLKKNSITFDCSKTQHALEHNNIPTPVFGTAAMRVFVRNMLSNDPDFVSQRLSMTASDAEEGASARPEAMSGRAS